MASYGGGGCAGAAGRGREDFSDLDILNLNSLVEDLIVVDSSSDRTTMIRA
jgi:hypothetical protein